MTFLDRAFGTYYLERRLGGGGMGEVYLARRSDGREVALKLVELRDDAEGRDIVAAERVGAKLQQLFSAVDPHVPAVHAMGEANGFFFIEMEYVDGCDLAELIARGVSPAEATRLAADLAAFLEAAHGFRAVVDEREFRSLVHADLKPKNIRVNGRGDLKVLDFGISKGLSLSGRLTTAVFGSRSYMSPEWVESGRLDHQVDLWALGVVLYEMLAGHLPYQAESVRQLELALRGGAPPLPLPGTVPSRLHQIVRKALAPRIDRRYQTATAFKADLLAYLEGRPTVAETEPPVPRDAEVTRRTAPAASTAPDPTPAVPDALPPLPDAEVTRRTAPASAPVPPMPPVLPAASAPTSRTGAAAPARRGRLSTRTRVAAVALILFVMVNEHIACRGAAALRADLPTREDAQIDAAWQEYRRVESRSLLGFARRQVDDEMRDALATHATRVIDDFRRDRPTVRERQWQQAKVWLGYALRIDPGRTSLLARLRYCEGQLNRIDGEARLREGRRQDADRLLSAAVSRFEESADLDRAWADPWLGLLRTYVYALEDIKKAIAALNEAERRGYRAGRREFVQLGLAHYQIADRSRRECEELPDDDRCECLRRSGQSYAQAMTWLERGDGDTDLVRGQSRARAGLQVVTDQMLGLGCALEMIPAAREH